MKERVSNVFASLPAVTSTPRGASQMQTCQCNASLKALHQASSGMFIISYYF